MKTRNIKRRKQYTKKRGGSKNACKIPKGRNAQPTPIEYNGKESEIPEKSYHKLSEAISDVPNDNFIVLKVGSNDSNEVVSGKYSGKVNNINYGQSFGSKGKEGHHYIEISREKSDISEIKDMKSPSSRPFLSRYIKTLNKMLNNIDGTLISISPIPEYEDYSYPFISDESEEPSIDTMLFSVINNNIKDRKYIQGFFPLSPNNEKNKKLLDKIINHKSPVILFNSISSTCHLSLKYIIDIRNEKGYETIYMGLSDVLENVACDISEPIYPEEKHKKLCE